MKRRFALACIALALLGCPPENDVAKRQPLESRPVLAETPPAAEKSHITEDSTLAGLQDETMGGLTGMWTVTGIAYNELPAEVKISLEFGNGGFEAFVCNRIRGSVDTGNGQFNLGEMSVDNNECDTPVMNAERNFISAFELANRFEIDAEDTLRLISGDTVLVTAKRTK